MQILLVLIYIQASEIPTIPSRGTPPHPPSRAESNSTSIDRVQTYLILAFSWRGAQQPPEKRIGIPLTAVEKPAIEYLRSPAL